jgi:Ca2+-binding RTX toxin-like protein
LDLLISPEYGDAPLSENKILIGSKGIDSINGAEKAELLYGGAGNDTLIGNGGNDFLQGGQGNDTYIYNSGDGFDARPCKIENKLGGEVKFVLCLGIAA